MDTNQQGIIRLWPEGAPGAEHQAQPEQEVPAPFDPQVTALINVSQPSLTVARATLKPLPPGNTETSTARLTSPKLMGRQMETRSMAGLAPTTRITTRSPTRPTFPIGLEAGAVTLPA